MASTRPKQTPYQTGEYQKTNKTSAIRSFISKRAQGNVSPSRPIFELASNVSITVPSPSKSEKENRPTSAHYTLYTPHPLGEIHSNQQKYAPSPVSSPTKAKNVARPDMLKARSAISLKTLSREHESKKENVEPGSTGDSCKSPPKKQRSVANLALQNILSRPKSAKNLKKQAEADEAARSAKERDHAERLKAAEAAEAALRMRPPIFAQFSSDYFAKQALGGKFLESPIDDDDFHYPPLPESPTKECGSFDWDSQSRSSSPSKQSSIKSKSTYLLAGQDEFVVSDITRQNSTASRRARLQQHIDEMTGVVQQKDGMSQQVLSSCQQHELPATNHRTNGVPHSVRKEHLDDKTHDFHSTNLSLKSKEHPHDSRIALWRTSRPTSMSPSKNSRSSKADILSDINIKEVDSALEELLDRRNIPEDQRHKMRDVALVVKLDLIKHERKEAEESKLKKSSRDVSRELVAVDDSLSQHTPDVKKRPRSKTFTFSRSSKMNSSPTKKARPETSVRSTHHMRTKSSDSLVIPANIFASPATASTALDFLHRGGRSTTPEDFVKYLQKVTLPEKVDIRKMQKLKQLLRNEKIGWTDEFIFLDGMSEVIALLHRIMEVEWREEHEDTLLHETLLCLKALCTTTLAQTHLEKIHSTLFPALVKMLFDPEHKGPAEFSTRHIITNLLFTYLKSSPLSGRHDRAVQMLGYLRDTTKAPEERPVEFIEVIHTPRPYKSWTQEVYSVSKDVFWIFLHGLNVVSLPSRGPNNESSSIIRPTIPEYAYMSTHFPADAPPRPAAPHVGSVEWDATNYLTSHLDLLNGIIASLSTVEARNSLRSELRLSGMEKCLGDELRRCKEKFYPALHCSLRCWVGAATADGWNTRDVRCGGEVKPVLHKQNGKKKKVEPAPKLELGFDFPGASGVSAGGDVNLSREYEDTDLGSRDLIGKKESQEDLWS